MPSRADRADPIKNAAYMREYRAARTLAKTGKVARGSIAFKDAMTAAVAETMAATARVAARAAKIIERPLHVVSDRLFGDVTRPPSDAENAAALEAQGWTWQGVTFEHLDRQSAAREPPRPSRHVQTMTARGFKTLHGDGLNQEAQMRQIAQDMEIERSGR